MGVDRFDLRVEWAGVPWLRSWPAGQWRLLDPVSQIFQFAETWVYADRVVVERVAGLRDASSINPRIHHRVILDFFDVELLMAAAVQSRRWKALAKRYRGAIAVRDDDPGAWEARWREADRARIDALQREGAERRRREDVEAMLRDKELEFDEIEERIEAVIGTMISINRRRPKRGAAGAPDDVQPGPIGNPVPELGHFGLCDDATGRCVHLRDAPLAVSCTKQPALLLPTELRDGPTWCPGKEVELASDAG
jgi:hypothetical protein